MNTKLHLTTKTAISTLAFSLCLSFGYSQDNLIQNPGADFYSETGENVDAFDMTPNKTLKDNSGTEIDSPYRFDATNNPAGWNNTDLQDFIAEKYGDSEQPGTTADGAYEGENRTVGLKISSNDRRIYQLVPVTQGVEYTFTVDTRSEFDTAINPEIFILNNEITTEDGSTDGTGTSGIDALKASSSDVDAYLEITNDVNTSKGDVDKNTFTKSTITFTASQDQVIIYMRSLGSVSGTTEFFVDNLSLIETSKLSAVDHAFSSKFQLTPNPTTNVFNVVSKESFDSIEVYDMLGKEVNAFVNGSSVDISSLTSGFYIVKVTSGNSVAIKRVIKN